MVTKTLRRWRVVLHAGIAVALSTGAAQAYLTYAKWGTSPVSFFINPKNNDVSESAAIAALKYGMDIWNTQAGTTFRFTYAGQVTDTSTGNDRRNVIIFRNASSGTGAIASTYSWWSNGILVDSDIIYWDGAFTFFTGTSGCGGSNAAYIEDIAAHEFGHALGLSHSTIAGATMTPPYYTCSQSQRTLHADDIAAARSLYPSESLPTNSAPTVSVLTPSNGASFPEGTLIAFSGSATDSQDGNLSSLIKWKSNLMGSLGTGASRSKVLSVGPHTITASVTDSGGLVGSKAISVTVVGSGQRTLKATGSVVDGLQRVKLTWSGFTNTSVDVYKDGAKVTNTLNDGLMVHKLNVGGSATYVYRLCEPSNTSSCSNQATVSF